MDYEKLSGNKTSETTCQRVQATRNIQQTCFKALDSQSSNIISNAGMRIRKVRQFFQLQDDGQSLMRAAMTPLNLSARAYHRTRSVKLSRMIADLVGSEDIQSLHLGDALQYRLKIMMD